MFGPKHESIFSTEWELRFSLDFLTQIQCVFSFSTWTDYDKLLYTNTYKKPYGRANKLCGGKKIIGFFRTAASHLLPMITNNQTNLKERYLNSLCAHSVHFKKITRTIFLKLLFSQLLLSKLFWWFFILSFDLAPHERARCGAPHLFCLALLLRSVQT